MTPLSVIPADGILWPESYGLHPDHCRDVLAGSYDVPFSPAKPPVILDLGANCGAFVRWAVARWPGCAIHAYEPEPGNYSLLKRTIDSLVHVNYWKLDSIQTHQQAVGGHTCKAALHEGEFNCGEWSLMMDCGKSSVEVDVISALDLPKADILKIDTEGMEATIMAMLTGADRIREFSAIMLEVHNGAWVAPIKFRLAEAGFTLTGEKSHSEHRVELKFVRSDLLCHVSEIHDPLSFNP